MFASVVLTSEQKEEIFKRISQINDRRKQILEKIKSIRKSKGNPFRYSMRQFIPDLMKCINQNTDIISFKVKKDNKTHVISLRIPKDVIEGVKEIKEKYESRVSECFIRTVMSMSRKRADKFKKTCGWELEDVVNESLVALSYAIYNYSDPNQSQFHTYLRQTISQHLRRELNYSRPLCALSPKEEILMAEFFDIESKNPSMSFEEIAKKMKLDKEQQIYLRKMITPVRNFSSYHSPKQTEEGFDDVVDIQSIQTDGENAIGSPDDIATKVSNKQLVEVLLTKSNLTDWEKLCVKEWLENECGRHGWATKVSRKYVDSATGKPITSMVVTKTFEIAMKKMKKTAKQIGCAA